MNMSARLISVLTWLLTVAAFAQTPAQPDANQYRLGKDAALLWVSIEKCRTHIALDKNIGDRRYEEMVSQGMDSHDDLAFLKGLSEGLAAALGDFTDGRIHKAWCDNAKIHLMDVAPELFHR